MGTFAILGDDLTGAMDAGVQLVRKGFSVSAAVHEDFMEDISGLGDVVVVNTETRNTSPDTAFRVVAESVRKMEHAGLRLLYKKVDSTLRGNIGRELEAVLKGGNYGMVLFAPALPFNGRTTRKGYHFLDGVRLIESDLSMDPFAPVKSSYIPEIIKYQTSIPVGNIELEEVRKGADSLLKKILKLHSRGVGIAVADAENAQDLKNLAAALEKCNLKILPCGSAGLLSEMFPYPEGAGTVRPVPFPAEKGPVLVISGSPAGMTKIQLEAAGRSGEKVIRLDCRKADGDQRDWQLEVERVKDSALKELMQGRNVVIDGAGKSKMEIHDNFKGRPEILAASGHAIRTALTDIFTGIVDRGGIAGAVIIGGETAVNIFERMGVKGLKIKGEVEPFVPAGCLIGGTADKLPVVTKAGGFGTENVIIEAVKFLQGE